MRKNRRSRMSPRRTSNSTTSPTALLVSPKRTKKLGTSDVPASILVSPRRTLKPGTSDAPASHTASFLFIPEKHNSTTSLIVPETPTNNSPCLSATLATISTMASVMETPEDEDLPNCNPASKTVKQVKANKRKSESPVFSDDDDESNLLDITPDLNLGRRKKLMSLLESEHSFTKSLKSQTMKNSSMLPGKNENGRIRAHPNKDVIVSPKISRKRRSMAHVILPFDLNDSDHLSKKLSEIKDMEQKSRRSSITPIKALTFEKESRRSVASLVTPTRQRNPRRSVSALATPRRQRELRKSVDSLPQSTRQQRQSEGPSRAQILSRTQNEKVGQHITSPVFQTKISAQLPVRDESRAIDLLYRRDSDDTIHFESDDIILTPTQGRGQIGVQLAISNAIEKLRRMENARNLEAAQRAKENPSYLTSKILNTCSSGRSSENVSEEVEKSNCSLTGNFNNNNNNSDPKLKEEPQEPTGPPPDPNTVLQGVVAYVEVRMGSDNRSGVIKDQLRALGAEVRDRLSVKVTHVIFKDGSKSVFTRAKNRGVHLLSSLWVEACRVKLTRVPECHYPSCSIEQYTTSIVPGKLRKMRSMQPKEFSEVEQLAAERARRRRLRNSNSPNPTASTHCQPVFFTPQNHIRRKPLEDIGSPLFGIGHLLTPQRRASASSSSSEENEEGGSGGGLVGEDLEQDQESYKTPLAKRLYDRFISPRSDFEQEGQSRLGRRKKNTSKNSSNSSLSIRTSHGELNSGIENMECQLTVPSDDSRSGEQSREMGEDMLTLRLSSDTDSRLNSQSIVELPLLLDSFSPKPSTSRNCEFIAQTRKSSSGVGNIGVLENSDSSICVNVSDASVNERLSDLSVDKGQNTSDMSVYCETDIIDKKLGKKRKSDGVGEPVLETSNSSLTELGNQVSQIKLKENIMNVQADNTSNILKNIKNGRTLGAIKDADNPRLKSYNIPNESSSTSNKNYTLGKKCNKTVERGKTNNLTKRKTLSDMQTSRKLSSVTESSQRQTSKTFLSTREMSESQDKAMFSASQSSQIICSQSQRHKLLSIDTLEPSQELVVPVTPELGQKKNAGAYAKLQVISSKTQRNAMRDQRESGGFIPLPCTGRFKKACSSSVGHNDDESYIPSSCTRLSKILSSAVDAENRQPDMNIKKESTELSSIQRKCKSAGSNSKQQPLRQSQRSGKGSLSGVSSGEDNVFGEGILSPIPRPRRSTEEFRFNGVLKPKLKRKTKSSNTKTISICLTSFHSKEKVAVLPIIRKLGNAEILEEVGAKTTHVVCGEERRTLSFLMGVARGCWVLSEAWLYESLEMNFWAPEEPFEMFVFAPATKICREQRESQGSAYCQTLFSGVGSVCVLDGCSPPTSDLKELLSLCSGNVVNSVRCANLVVGRSPQGSKRAADCGGPTHVSEKWVLDCVVHHKILPTVDYQIK